jgi:hypothetical protein
MHAPLIYRARTRGRQTPMRQQLLAVKHAERRVRVTNVDYQKHEFRDISRTGEDNAEGGVLSSYVRITCRWATLVFARFLMPKILKCSFCEKTQHEVRRLVEGHGAYICNECIDICDEILEDHGDRPKRSDRAPQVDLDALGIKPRFKKVKFTQRDNHCFYLGPFSNPFDDIYRDHVVKAVKSEGFTIERADEIFGTEPIIEDIWEAINSASLIVADVTGRNPNVMYEIGMAHTVGKPVVIITQNIDDVPFDLKHYRCIIYNYTPKGCDYLEGKLAATVRFLKSRIT